MAGRQLKTAADLEQQEVAGVASTSDGSRVLTVTKDGTARLWDVATRTCLYELQVGEPSVGACCPLNSPRKKSIRYPGTYMVIARVTRKKTEGGYLYLYFEKRLATRIIFSNPYCF